jgi:hypothetical protein
MTIRPGAAGSWLILAAAALSGLVAGIPRGFVVGQRARCVKARPCA